jgi:glycosyltransferase involved in cell wall biosynthesis
MIRKRVLIIYDILWAHYKGKIYSELYKILSKNNYDFLVIQQALSEKGREKLGDVDLSIHQYPYKLLFKSNIEDIPIIGGILKIIKEIYSYRPNVIVIHGYSHFLCWVALFLGKFILRCKVIIGMDTTEYDNLHKSYKEFAKRFFVRFCDYAFCYGTKAKEYIIKLGMSPEKAIIKCQAVDNQTFEKIYNEHKDKREYLTLNNGFKRYNFIYVGRLSKEKNVETLIKTFKLLKANLEESEDWGLILVGEGEKKEYLKYLVKELNVEDIYFLGGKLWKEVPIYYALADVFILPSISEPWGLVVNEAMVCGLPVIVSDRAGSAYDLVKEGENGFIFSPFSEKELFEKMAFFVKNLDKIKKMGEYSKRIIAEYTPENAAYQMFKGICKVLGEEIL